MLMCTKLKKIQNWTNVTVVNFEVPLFSTIDVASVIVSNFE